MKVNEIKKRNGYRLLNSVVVYQNNELVFETYYNNYTENSRNNIKSIWKSILSVCAGICLDKGFINSLDEPICHYLDEFNQNIHPFHKLITIKHLLTMSSGIYWVGGVHYHCPTMEQLYRSRNWLEHMADTAMSDLPGTKFNYKELDVILLSAVIEKASGMTSFEFCNKYLYEPLGIKSGVWARPCNVDYNIGRTEEEQNKSNLSAKELAKIGLLFLNNTGEIVSKDYVRESVAKSSVNSGYGYLWWLFGDFYGGRGFGGQELNICSDKNLVYVIQATASNRSKSYTEVSDFIRESF